MGHEFHHIIESKKLIWVTAMVFGVVIMLQYFEFPYGDVASSLFSIGRAQPPESRTLRPQASSTNPKTLSNITGSDHSTNYTTPVDSVEENKPLAPDKANNIVHDPSMQETDLDTASSNSTVYTSPISPSTNTSDPHVGTPNPVVNLVSPVNSSVKEVSHERPMADIVTISEMHDILLHNRAIVRSVKSRWPSMVDQELLDAKSQIENAHVDDNDRALYPLYRNVSRFKRSYELMVKTLKVYIYKEGKKPIFHQPNLRGIYASEGWFMKHMKESKHFVTLKPKEAHLFYIPFSSQMLEEKLFVPGSHGYQNLIQYLKNYHDMIAKRYNFWKRTNGSDHFVVACHDWATYETSKTMDSCIRALCNSDVKREDFELGKDVSLPETYVRSPQNPLRELGGNPSANRSILAFFAGQMHGHVRPILLQHWENKDPDMKIFRDLRKTKDSRNYIKYMKSSKYCICAKGYEVNSPRVVEAIFYECVPVIISDNFVPPFFEILNWESFAVFVLEKDIPNLKSILLSISEKRYLVMQERVKKVQHHFLWHLKPVKYDIFHMILHSIWYNRVFRVTPPVRVFL